ncbi:MAG: Arc family DNA-binding protein [Xanthomonadales bacterium]|nr:Arc family DNA-binding protein [Xanthomonadales bacterium]
MPNLSIKNVPAMVVASLRERASANHRSLQGELLALVSQAAASTQVSASTQAAASTQESVNKLATVAAEPSQGIRKGHKSIEQIAAEHRQHSKRPSSKGQRSTELVRQDRDAR